MKKMYTGEMGRLKSFETQKPPFDAKNPYLATVAVNRQLNQAGDRHLMHLELDISGSQIRYDSGDHVAVYPINDVSIVNRIGQILDADLDTVISLNNLEKESNKKHPFPCPTTYRTALTHYLDITNPPRTNVLFELAQYATDPKDQDILRKMASASPEGKGLYQSLVLDSQRNILAVLEDMPSLHPTIDHLCVLRHGEHLCGGGGVPDQHRAELQGSGHQLAEEQVGGDGQRPQGHGAHVRPQVPVPAALQGQQPGGDDWARHRHRPLHGLPPGERLDEGAREGCRRDDTVLRLSPQISGLNVPAGTGRV
nr:NADPH--cytochrome P450 reductase-like isoform X1 [Oncorhynchus nerka]